MPTQAFINGHIITMDGNSRVVEAMLVRDGRLEDLGTNRAIGDKITSSVRVIDLGGRTVLPGFIDAHSHFPVPGVRQVSVDLSPPPVGTTDTIEVLLNKIAAQVKLQSSDDWLLGFNYDNTVLANGEHPTRKQLDSVAPDHPVYLWHNSGHMGVANSRALALLSIDESTAPASNMLLGRNSETGQLNGLLQETAAPSLATIVGKFSWLTQFRILTEARDAYLAQGVTTVQNGYAGLNMMRVLKAATITGLVPQRVVVWPARDKKGVEQVFSAMQHETIESDFKFKNGAIKFLVDGSPQGLTAFLSKPFFNPKAHPKHFRGIALIDQDSLTSLVRRYHANGYQIALHGNGDQAIEYIINAVEAAQTEYPRDDARHIIVHAQTIRKDQLARLNAVGLTPSFFNSHTFYWGDWHRQISLGPDRAASISPTGWASELGVRFTLHSDAPVTPINPMQMLWSATKRQTSSGFELGAEQQIDMDTALRAITIDAAWQNHIDEAVGSLETGKQADFVVLSDNPYEADDVRLIEVVATYIAGVKHYGAARGFVSE